MSVKEIIVAQNRAEELLLELIYDRVLATSPPKLSDAAVLSEDKRMTEAGYSPTPEDLARRKGYDEGWWDAVQSLSNVISNHKETNNSRLDHI
jgi:hypothetical protein